MTGLEGKQILITGAAGHLASEAIFKLSNAGAKLIGVDRNKERLEDMQRKGFLVACHIGDLADPHFQQFLVQRYRDTLDVLINNLGGGFSRALENTTREDYLHLWRLNFEVAAMLCQGFMPAMRKRRGGKIINVSTILADNPLPTLSAYAASKAALIAFTKSVALEYAPFGVHANVLAPGYIRGSKHEAYFGSEAGRTFMERFMPTGKTGLASDLAGAFVFLASPLSNHITGQVIKCDGGYSVW